MEKQNTKPQMDEIELTKEQKFDLIKEKIQENESANPTIEDCRAKMKLHEKEYHKYAALLEETKKKVIINLTEIANLTK